MISFTKMLSNAFKICGDLIMWNSDILWSIANVKNEYEKKRKKKLKLKKEKLLVVSSERKIFFGIRWP